MPAACGAGPRKSGDAGAGAASRAGRLDGMDEVYVDFRKLSL